MRGGNRGAHVSIIRRGGGCVDLDGHRVMAKSQHILLMTANRLRRLVFEERLNGETSPARLAEARYRGVLLQAAWSAIHPIRKFQFRCCRRRNGVLGIDSTSRGWCCWLGNKENWILDCESGKEIRLGSPRTATMPRTRGLPSVCIVSIW